MLNENIYTYINNKKRLIPLNKKIPILPNWVNSNLSQEEIENYNTTNYGWVLNKTDLVIDIDPRNGGDESFNKLIDNIGIKLFPTVKTPGGGYHIYLSKPENINISKSIKDYPGIDFLSIGTQCVIPGSITEKGTYKWLDEFNEFNYNETPEKLLTILSKDNYEIDDFDFSDGNNNIVDYKDYDIKEMLNKIDPSCEYDTWIKIGMAIHSWDKNLGLELWEQWSKSGTNYEIGETEKHWKSFNNKPLNSITLGTLVFLANKEESEINKKDFEQLQNEINNATTKDKLELLMNIIRKKEFEEIDKEILTKLIQTKFKDILGVKVSIKDIRKKVAQIYKKGEAHWCDNWVYINSHNCFINIMTKQFHRTESFNIENGKFIALNDSGNKQSASKYVADNGIIKKVDAVAYLPESIELITHFNNRKILNIFDYNSIPETAIDYTNKGLKAIEVIKEHIKIICNNDFNNIEILTQWLAHQIQFPGKKILWSPVIQAIQGIGKSFFGELLRCCLGDINVGTISPGQVTSQFNGWANGTAVNVLEELRVVGHNRFDVINALKPLITDRIIQINDKGVKQFMTYNTANYICFTNYKDAIPIDQDDRRWWVLFVDIKELVDLEKIANKPLNTYFTDLFDSLRENATEIRKWLIDYKIEDSFMNIKQAPVTNYKRAMISTEENNLEGLLETKELLNRGGEFFNSVCADSCELFEHVLLEYPDLFLTTHQKNKILKKLGFILFEHRMRLKGKLRKIWTTCSLNKNDILKSFNMLDIVTENIIIQNIVTQNIDTTIDINDL